MWGRFDIEIKKGKRIRVLVNSCPMEIQINKKTEAVRQRFSLWLVYI